MLKICRLILEPVGVVLAAITEDDLVRPLRFEQSLAFQVGDHSYVDSWANLQASLPPDDFYNGVTKLVAGLEDIGTLSDLQAQGRLLSPLDEQEVWAAGVTYWRSRTARMDESDAAESLYDLVYKAERPEIFFKATSARVVGTGDYIGVRGDSRWTVPEPELAVLLDANLKPLGLTICNDVSSRDIEGANPLYLPQAKIYNHSCSVGPVVLLLEQPTEKPELRIECIIKRAGTEVFHVGTSTAQLVRTIPQLVEYLGRYNSFPGGVLLSTGTGIVPPDDFTLQAGDLVEIEIETIGRLSNTVKILK